jgi:acyl-CoA thioesterase-1
MKTPFHIVTLAAAVAAVTFLAGCSTGYVRSAQKNRLTGESVVLIGEESARLAFRPVLEGSVSVRNTYGTNLPQTVTYELGRDFTIDYELGEIRRTAQSRIPDFRTNMLYGVEDFDHSKFPGFGNGNFFVSVDYTSRRRVDWPRQTSQVHLLPRTWTKLVRGDAIKIVAFGDSITAGGDATTTELIFWRRWADALKTRHPEAQIVAINGATGGDRTAEGLQRLQQKVLDEKPDVVLIGFGMNDHNIGGFGVPLNTFERNLESIIDRIRQETSAEMILYSTFPPNPKWHFGSKNMEAYAFATEKVAMERRCAFADVYRNWLEIESRKKPEDLLGNNINHPNDFGHWMYFQVLEKIGL